MALLLVVGAPAVVASIDGDLSAEKMLPTGYVDDANMAAYFKMGDTWQTTDKMTVVKPSANNGTATVAFNTPADANTTSSVVLTAWKASDLADAKVRKIDLTFSGKAPTSAYASVKKLNDTSASFNMPITFDEETNVWTLNVSSVDSVRIASGDYDTVSFPIAYTGGAPASIDIGIKTYSLLSFNLGEVIIGALGALLILCAVLATPWFGLDVIRRRSR